jgi:hypothetical protein
LPSLAADALLIAVVYAIALTLLRASYQRSGRVWVLRHCIVLPHARRPSQRAWVEGWIGEAVILTLAATASLIIAWFTPDISLVGLLGRWWWQTIAATILVAVIVHLYSTTVIRAAVKEGRKPVYCKRLQAAYATYNFYSVCLFGVGAMVLMMLAAQYLSDGAAFRAEARVISDIFDLARVAALSSTEPDAGMQDRYVEAMTLAENGFGRIALAAKLLQSQFNPLFVFAGLLIGINMLINFTPLKHMFMGEAVVMTAIFTYGPLAIIGLFALAIYLGSYETLLESVLANVRMFTPPPGLGDWEIAQRHSEMVAELANSMNLFGFIRMIAGEGGGFAILAWGLQLALEKISDKKEAAAPLRLPSSRFRPNAG